MRKQTSTNYVNEQGILCQCPFARTIDVLGGRWRTVVLWKILDGTRRFSDLRRAIPAITEKMLAQTLREAEEQSLITRVVVSEKPLHVTYHATPLTQSLAPILRGLHEWGEQNPFK